MARSPDIELPPLVSGGLYEGSGQYGREMVHGRRNGLRREDGYREGSSARMSVWCACPMTVMQKRLGLRPSWRDLEQRLAIPSNLRDEVSVVDLLGSVQSWV